MMPDIFGNYGPDPMLTQRPQGLEAILMPLQGIQGPLQQIVDEMPSQINSYVDEEIQRRMDEMKSTPSPTDTNGSSRSTRIHLKKPFPMQDLSRYRW